MRLSEQARKEILDDFISGLLNNLQMRDIELVDEEAKPTVHPTLGEVHELNQNGKKFFVKIALIKRDEDPETDVGYVDARLSLYDEEDEVDLFEKMDEDLLGAVDNVYEIDDAEDLEFDDDEDVPDVYQMGTCDLCGEEVLKADLITCQTCGYAFCPDCGDENKKLCEDCC